MSCMTQLFSEGVVVAADGIHSASQSTSEKLTGAVDLSKFRQVLFLIDAGTLGASGTLDFQVKGATTSGGRTFWVRVRVRREPAYPFERVVTRPLSVRVSG